MASLAASHRRDLGPGWITTLLGVVLLIAGGFLVGLLVGIVSQEPELLMGHLAGRSEVVEWSPEPLHPLADSQPVLPSVSAPDPPQERVRRDAPRPSAFAPSRRGGPSAQGYAVQVGAFSDGWVAESLATSLEGKGFPAYVSPSAGSTEQRWRVRVGPVATRVEADALAGRLKSDELLPTWVLNQAEH